MGHGQDAAPPCSMHSESGAPDIPSARFRGPQQPPSPSAEAPVNDATLSEVWHHSLAVTPPSGCLRVVAPARGYRAAHKGMPDHCLTLITDLSIANAKRPTCPEARLARPAYAGGDDARGLRQSVPTAVDGGTMAPGHVLPAAACRRATRLPAFCKGDAPARRSAQADWQAGASRAAAQQER